MQRYDNSALQSKFTANYFYKKFKYHGEGAGKQRDKKHGNIHKHDKAQTVQDAIAHVQAMMHIFPKMFSAYTILRELMALMLW